MVCCVKQAATGESPVGRGPNRKVSFKIYSHSNLVLFQLLKKEKKNLSVKIHGSENKI